MSLYCIMYNSSFRYTCSHYVNVKHLTDIGLNGHNRTFWVLKERLQISSRKEKICILFDPILKEASHSDNKFDPVLVFYCSLAGQRAI